MCLILSIVNSQILKNQVGKNPVNQSTTSVPTNSPTPTNINTVTPNPPVDLEIDTLPDYQGKKLFFFSSNPTGKYQIYVFSPGLLPTTQLFEDEFEKIHPKINPDQTKIAFSAKKNGYWDIYIFDFLTQSEIRVTDTPEYEGSPEWSPDGLYIAYETYKNGNLDIYIKSLKEINQVPIQLTDSIAADYSPAWSPDGREIAFVSTRSGEDEIWLAQLDNVENRFKNISISPDKNNEHPVWSSNGDFIIWSSDVNGYPTLQKYIYSAEKSNTIQFSEGSFPFTLENQIYFIQLDANFNYLSSRNMKDNSVEISSTFIPG
jgi:TolB protein